MQKATRMRQFIIHFKKIYFFKYNAIKIMKYENVKKDTEMSKS